MTFRLRQGLLEACLAQAALRLTRPGRAAAALEALRLTRPGIAAAAQIQGKDLVDPSEIPRAHPLMRMVGRARASLGLGLVGPCGLASSLQVPASFVDAVLPSV